MALNEHGVYITERETSLISPINGTAGLQVVFGTAPVNLTDDPQGAVNTPVIAYTYAEAAQQLGYSDDWEHYTLCQSMSACFQVFGVSPVIFINVLDPEKHRKALEETEINIAAGSGTVKETGILKSAVSVSCGDTACQEGEDYLLAFDSSGYLKISAIPGGKLEGQSTAVVSGFMLDPEAVTKEEVIGGLDPDTGKETGIELVRAVYPKTGMTPGLLLAPGWSHIPEVAAAIQAKCTGINGCYSCECLIDIDSAKAKKYTDVKTVKEKTGITSVHAMALWPMVKIGEQKYWYSAILGALIAYSDATNDNVPNLSPSNQLMSITAACTLDGTEILLDQEQANLLNAQGVSTALNMNGFRAWGNKSAAYPNTTDPKDCWFNCRRFFSWWGNTFILTYFQKVDKPANYRLIESIVDSENIRGHSYVARGYCARAEITFDYDENPVTDLMNGKIQFHQYLSPYVPAEVIKNTLEFDPLAIQSALATESAV